MLCVRMFLLLLLLLLLLSGHPRVEQTADAAASAAVAGY
jgi:hypothetical protein